MSSKQNLSVTPKGVDVLTFAYGALAVIINKAKRQDISAGEVSFSVDEVLRLLKGRNLLISSEYVDKALNELLNNQYLHQD